MDAATETMAVAPLREDVRFVDNPGNPRFPGSLVDPTLEQKIKLDGLGLDVARLLDRPQTEEQLLSRLSELGGPSPEAAQRALQLVAGLRRLFLLDDARARAAVEERRAMDAWTSGPIADVPLHYLPDARFDCTGCGGCCGGHNVGPVEPHVRERLASDEGRAFLTEYELTPGDIYIRRDESSPTAEGEPDDVIALRSRDGWCVFLAPDSRCRIHGRWGGHAKPHVCQLFPYLFVVRPDGLAVSLQTECRDILAGAREGRPFSEQEDELRQLSRLPGNLTRVRPAVVVDGMATLAYRDWATLRERLVEQLAEPVADPIACLTRMWNTIDTDSHSTAAGQRADVSPLGSAAELREAFHETVQQLGGRLVNLRRELANETAERVVRLTGLEKTLGGLTRLMPALERVLAPPQDPGARELFRLLARNALMSESLSSGRSLRHGMTMLALQWVLARAIAVDRAHDAKRPEPNAQDHVDGLALASFPLRSPKTTALIQQMFGALSLLFVDHLADLSTHARALSVHDPRVEIYYG